MSRSIEFRDLNKGLRAVVALVDGKVKGKAYPVGPRGHTRWLVRIDGRMFEPSESQKRFKAITSSPFKSFGSKREAVAFLKREVKAGNYE